MSCKQQLVIWSTCVHFHFAHLNKSGVDKNARTEGVKHSADNTRCRRLGCVGVAHAEAHSDTNRRRYPIDNRSDIWCPLVFGRQRSECESGAETEAFESLVEHEDDEEDGELLRGGNGKGEADKNRVEEDAELEDGDPDELRRAVVTNARSLGVAEVFCLLDITEPLVRVCMGGENMCSFGSVGGMAADTVAVSV
jgi:hypothetical protein